MDKGWYPRLTYGDSLTLVYRLCSELLFSNGWCSELVKEIGCAVLKHGNGHVCLDTFCVIHLNWVSYILILYHSALGDRVLAWNPFHCTHLSIHISAVHITHIVITFRLYKLWISCWVTLTWQGKLPTGIFTLWFHIQIWQIGRWYYMEE